jgi:GT2 family glycosyltransferase
MLGAVGLEPARRGRSRAQSLADDLVLTPESRRPLVLPESTQARVLARPVGAPASGLVPTTEAPVASVVVVVRDNLVCTRLCLESVLGADDTPMEILVVDNGSTDGTAAYLRRLVEHDPRVRVIANDDNVGFAAAVNQGIARARADAFVVLNNDTIVAPGWLHGLLAHLGDSQVGAVGPVTGRIGNEAEIPVDYESHGGFLDLAADRARRFAGRSFDIPVLALFCTALRRDVWERVGPLDEQFGLGLFEDDDYARRLRGAGYRLVCAEDVFVHHFGEATFGQLVATGAYARQFEENRRRYEHKWEVVWEAHGRRPDPDYDACVRGIQRLARSVLPADADVAVVSRGDGDLLALGRRARHFPADSTGEWAGHHPADSDEAVELLEAVRRDGATHLLVPESGHWWLEHYHGLREHLRSRAVLVHEGPECTLFALGGAGGDPRADELARSVS